MTMTNILRLGAATLVAGGLLAAMPANAQYRQKISNDLSRCSGASGPAIKVVVRGIDTSSGNIRVQSYRGTKADWLTKGKWINRVEERAKAGTMTFCMPFSAAGIYAIAVRHDKNGNGKTDISSDGGGMSNNPSINIFNLGKPSYKKTRLNVGNSVSTITVNMRYM